MRLVLSFLVCLFFFFFQAEGGIRDVAVTGVQTCALPISLRLDAGWRPRCVRCGQAVRELCQIGRASCRERGEISVVAVSLKKKKKQQTVAAIRGPAWQAKAQTHPRVKAR